MQLRWSAANRCRADARVTRLLPQPGRNSPQFKQTSFVSQQHWTTHYSTQMQPQPWNKTSLPCKTALLPLGELGCLTPWWDFYPWTGMETMIRNTFINHPSLPTKPYKCTRMPQDRTTKLEGWNSQCMPSLHSISQHFLFALLQGGRNGPQWEFWPVIRSINDLKLVQTSNVKADSKFKKNNWSKFRVTEEGT